MARTLSVSRCWLRTESIGGSAAAEDAALTVYHCPCAHRAARVGGREKQRSRFLGASVDNRPQLRNV